MPVARLAQELTKLRPGRLWGAGLSSDAELAGIPQKSQASGASGFRERLHLALMLLRSAEITGRGSFSRQIFQGLLLQDRLHFCNSQEKKKMNQLLFIVLI